MAQTIGSLDLNAFSDLYSDSTQYFWFEPNASATYGAGAHVTLVPDTSFISNPTGQNILMNTDGFSIRNGLLPMMTLDNNSLDFNVVDTTAGTYTTTATFTSTGAQIGKSNGAHSVIDANGQRFYGGSDGTTQLANIGYGEGAGVSGADYAPYYTFGTRVETAPQHSSSQTYAVGDICIYNNKLYVCRNAITTPRKWIRTDWQLAIGNYSVAEGVDTVASGYFSHAEGNMTVAAFGSAHAEGEETKALGVAAHSEGYLTIASGYNAHAQGEGTIANRLASTAIGLYNISDTDGNNYTRGNYAFIIGNGTADDARSNALTVDWGGNITVNNHSSSIGTMLSHIPDAISCATGRYYQLAYLTLDAGVWMIDCVGQFPNTNTTGIRDLFVTTDTSGYNNVTTSPSAYGVITRDRRIGAAHIIYCNAHFPVNVESTTTFRLIGYQNSGQTNSVLGRMYAVRIK